MKQKHKRGMNGQDLFLAEREKIRRRIALEGERQISSLKGELREKKVYLAMEILKKSVNGNGTYIDYVPSGRLSKEDLLNSVDLIITKRTKGSNQVERYKISIVGPPERGKPPPSPFVSMLCVETHDTDKKIITEIEKIIF